MQNATEWKMHARQTRSMAECAERFGQADLARYLSAAADEMEHQMALAEAIAAGATGCATIHRLPTEASRKRVRKAKCVAPAPRMAFR